MGISCLVGRLVASTAPSRHHAARSARRRPGMASISTSVKFVQKLLENTTASRHAALHDARKPLQIGWVRLNESQ